MGVTGLEITNDYVHVASAYPTSGVDGGYYRHYQCPYFLNYCPGCGCYGTISFEQCNPSNGVIPGFTSIEGMYYCTSCDMDFSCISGMEHGSTGYCLYYYQPPTKPEPEDLDKNTTKEVVVEPKPTHKTIEYHGPIKSHRLKVPMSIAEKLNI